MHSSSRISVITVFANRACTCSMWRLVNCTVQEQYVLSQGTHLAASQQQEAAALRRSVSSFVKKGRSRMEDDWPLAHLFMAAQDGPGLHNKGHYIYPLESSTTGHYAVTMLAATERQR